MLGPSAILPPENGMTLTAQGISKNQANEIIDPTETEIGDEHSC
jgi:hypothetical protein